MLQKLLRPGKTLEASYIALLKSDLNEQKNFKRLALFINGVT